jgi:hypothetical protein
LRQRALASFFTARRRPCHTDRKMPDEKLVKRIRANAAELERLRYRISVEFRNSDEAVREKVDWNRAYRDFYESYDLLAFPGGIKTEIERLQNGDPGAIELAIEFLEADPYYFRSGYHKEELCKLLSKQYFTEDQCANVRKLIVDRVCGRTPGRIIRAFTRLAGKVADAVFEAKMSDIAAESNEFAARHAQQVICAVKSYRGMQKKLRGA